MYDGEGEIERKKRGERQIERYRYIAGGELEYGQLKYMKCAEKSVPCLD